MSMLGLVRRSLGRALTVEHGDLSSIPRTYIKMPGMVVSFEILALGN